MERQSDNLVFLDLGWNWMQLLVPPVAERDTECDIHVILYIIQCEWGNLSHFITMFEFFAVRLSASLLHLLLSISLLFPPPLPPSPFSSTLLSSSSLPLFLLPLPPPFLLLPLTSKHLKAHQFNSSNYRKNYTLNNVKQNKIQRSRVFVEEWKTYGTLIRSKTLVTLINQLGLLINHPKLVF